MVKFKLYVSINVKILFYKNYQMKLLINFFMRINFFVIFLFIADSQEVKSDLILKIDGLVFFNHTVQTKINLYEIASKRLARGLQLACKSLAND